MPFSVMFLQESTERIQTVEQRGRSGSKGTLIEFGLVIAGFSPVWNVCVNENVRFFISMNVRNYTIKIILICYRLHL